MPPRPEECPPPRRPRAGSPSDPGSPEFVRSEALTSSPNLTNSRNGGANQAPRGSSETFVGIPAHMIPAEPLLTPRTALVVPRDMSRFGVADHAPFILLSDADLDPLAYYSVFHLERILERSKRWTVGDSAEENGECLKVPHAGLIVDASPAIGTESHEQSPRAEGHEEATDPAPSRSGGADRTAPGSRGG